MQVTLYIRKNIESSFRSEADKSALVNELLLKHYGTKKTEPAPKPKNSDTEFKAWQKKMEDMGPPDEQGTPETPVVPPRTGLEQLKQNTPTPTRKPGPRALRRPKHRRDDLI